MKYRGRNFVSAAAEKEDEDEDELHQRAFCF